MIFPSINISQKTLEGVLFMEEKIKELEYAKKAVISCLEHDGTLVDMHGLEYWAGVVESLRNEIKEML